MDWETGLIFSGTNTGQVDKWDASDTLNCSETTLSSTATQQQINVKPQSENTSTLDAKDLFPIRSVQQSVRFIRYLTYFKGKSNTNGNTRNSPSKAGEEKKSDNNDHGFLLANGPKGVGIIDAETLKPIESGQSQLLEDLDLQEAGYNSRIAIESGHDVAILQATNDGDGPKLTELRALSFDDGSKGVPHFMTAFKLLVSYAKNRVVAVYDYSPAIE